MPETEHGEAKAHNNPRLCDGIRKELCFQVDDGQGEYGPCEQQRCKQVRHRPQLPTNQHGERGGQYFYGGILGRDGRFARGATSAQSHPAEYRNIFPWAQPVSAFRALGWWIGNGLVVGYAIDNDVEKAADHHPNDAESREEVR